MKVFRIHRGFVCHGNIFMTLEGVQNYIDRDWPGAELTVEEADESTARYWEESLRDGTAVLIDHEPGMSRNLSETELRACLTKS